MPKSPWTETGTPVNLTAKTTSVDTTATESVDYLTNSDKITLMAQYAAELATKTSLDESASAWSTSSTYYDNAVAAISTELVASGAPSDWATTWPDGTTSGPWDAIQTRLSNLWAQVATQRTALQSSISAEQAGAAQATAISTAATDALNKSNAAILQSQPHKVSWAYASKPALPSASYPAGYYAITTDARTVQVNTAGTAWDDVLVATTGLFGTITANQLTVTSQGMALNADPLCQDNTAWYNNQATGTFITGVVGAPVGSTAIQSMAGARTDYKGTDAIPIDNAQNYHYEAWLYATESTEIAYLGIEWLDANKAHLSVSPAGWAGGSFSYLPTMCGNTSPLNTWTKYYIDFGPDSPAAIPAGAAYMVIFAGLNFSSVAGAAFRMTGVRIWQKVEGSLIVDGSITAAKANLSLLDAAVAHIKKLDGDEIDIINLNADEITTGTLSCTRVLFADGSSLATASRVVTSTASPTSALTASLSYQAIPGLGWSTATASTADVYTINASIYAYDSNDSSSPNILTVALCVDGNTSTPKVTWKLNLTTVEISAPLAYSFSGLSAGTHTIAFYVKLYVNPGGTAVIDNSGTQAVCQRVY